MTGGELRKSLASALKPASTGFTVMGRGRNIVCRRAIAPWTRRLTRGVTRGRPLTVIVSWMARPIVTHVPKGHTVCVVARDTEVTVCAEALTTLIWTTTPIVLQ